MRHCFWKIVSDVKEIIYKEKSNLFQNYGAHMVNYIYINTPLVRPGFCKLSEVKYIICETNTTFSKIMVNYIY